MSKSNNLVALLFIGLLLSTLFIMSRYQKGYKFDAPAWANVKKETNNKSAKVVRSEVLLDMGKNINLGLKMAIPFETRKQKSDLTRNLKRIQSDFLMDHDREGLRSLVQERNFKSIKEKLLRVVNHYTDKPIKNLYFEEFLIE